MPEPEEPGAHALRILIVVGTTGGGVGRHVRSVAASLTRAGHQVVIAAPPGTDDALDLTGSGARVVTVPVHDRPHPVQDARAVRALARLSRQADVVHAHGLRAGGLAALAQAPRPGRSRVPLAVTLHNARPAPGRGRARDLVVTAVHGALERLVARRADVVLGVSGDLEDRMSRLGARDVRHAVVPAPQGGPVGRTREQVRADLGLGERPLVVCVARLADQKGLPMLLTAAGHLDAPGGPQDPVVVVAGDGPLRGVLQARIDADHLPVRLLGWRADVPDLLAAADLVVSSAVWEGQPIAIQQALRAGAPVVATDVGGTAAVTGDAAVLVRHGDAPGLAREIVRLLGDGRARAELSDRARIRARQLPDDAAASDAVVALYRELVNLGRST